MENVTSSSATTPSSEQLEADHVISAGNSDLGPPVLCQSPGHQFTGPSTLLIISNTSITTSSSSSSGDRNNTNSIGASNSNSSNSGSANDNNDNNSSSFSPSTGNIENNSNTNKNNNEGNANSNNETNDGGNANNNDESNTGIRTLSSNDGSSSGYGSGGTSCTLAIPSPLTPPLSYYAVRDTFAIMPSHLPPATSAYGLSPLFGPAALPPVRYWQPVVVDNTTLMRVQQFALYPPSPLSAPLNAPLGAVCGLRYPPPVDQSWGVGSVQLALLAQYARPPQPYQPNVPESPPGVQQQVHQVPQRHQRLTRTVFTADQLTRLEAEYDRQQYLTPNDREHLAQELGLTDSQVRTWFQNRRMKHRRVADSKHK